MILRAFLHKPSVSSLLSPQWSTARRRLHKKPQGKVKLTNNLFKAEAVKKFMQEDGIAAEFRLIYREASSFQSHKVFQVAGMVIPLFPYYFAYKTWPDHLFFKYYIGQTLLALWMSALTFYNLRMFYRVPHRLYYSSTSSIYKVVLNQVLPWQKKLVVPFRPSEIAQVDTDKSGWKVTGITKFELIPVQRTLWLDKDSFHKPKDYWTLCGKEIRD